MRTQRVHSTLQPLWCPAAVASVQTMRRRLRVQHWAHIDRPTYTCGSSSNTSTGTVVMCRVTHCLLHSLAREIMAVSGVNWEVHSKHGTMDNLITIYLILSIVHCLICAVKIYLFINQYIYIYIIVCSSRWD